MFSLKKISQIFFLSLLFIQTNQAADKIKVGYFVYPPHMIQGATATAPKGAAVDVMEKIIAPKADIKVEWVGPVPFARLLTMLEAGEIDMIGLSVPNKERLEKFIFTQNAPLWGKQGLLVLKTEPIDSIKSADDLKGKTISKLLKGNLPKFFDENQATIKFDEVGGDNSAELNLKKVLAGRSFGSYFAFPDVLLYYAATEKALDKVKLIPYPGSEDNVKGFFPLSRKLDPKLASRITSAIEASTKDYDYLKMSQEYIDKAGK